MPCPCSNAARPSAGLSSEPRTLVVVPPRRLVQREPRLSVKSLGGDCRCWRHCLCSPAPATSHTFFHILAEGQERTKMSTTVVRLETFPGQNAFSTKMLSLEFCKRRSSQDVTLQHKGCLKLTTWNNSVQKCVCATRPQKSSCGLRLATKNIIATHTLNILTIM